jgi:hypothetical protein
MKNLGIMVMAATLLLSATAFAEEKAAAPAAAPSAPAKSDGPKYGPAGCGLGSMIFAPDSGFTQIFAATTNGTSANQTFGITSGTSNCDSGSGGSKSAKVFIQTNREALAKDIARGSGETLSSLSQLAGCSSSTAVGSSLQRNFKTIFPEASLTDQQVATNVMSSLRSDKALACRI